MMRESHFILNNKSIIGVVIGCLLLILLQTPYCIAQDMYVSPSSTVNDIENPYQNTSITISATVEDESGSGIASVTLIYYFYPLDNTTPNNPYYGTEYKKDTNAPWEWKFTFPRGKGRYEFYSVAIDNQGNREYSAMAGPPITDTYCIFNGDSSNLEIWFGVIILLIFIFALLTYWKKQSRKGNVNTKDIHDEEK